MALLLCLFRHRPRHPWRGACREKHSLDVFLFPARPAELRAHKNVQYDYVLVYLVYEEYQNYTMIPERLTRTFPGPRPAGAVAKYAPASNFVPDKIVTRVHPCTLALRAPS